MLLLPVALGWVGLTLGLALAARRLWRPRDGLWQRPLLTLPPVERPVYDVTAGLTDAAVLGLAAGLGAALAFDLGALGMLGTALAVAAALAVATGREAEGLARAVAGLAPLGPALLSVASARTAVSVVESGATQAYPWFPVWLAVILAVAGWAVVHRLGAERAARPVAMLWVGLPLAWLLVADLPGGLGPFDLRAEGETLSAAFAALDGRWPWTELSVIRGPWADAGRALVGMLVFDPTRWGAVAGQQMVLGPMMLAGNAALFAWLFGWRWPHAALATLVACLVDPARAGMLLLWAPTLAALALLLVRATVPRAALLVGLAAAQVVLVPAAATAAAAVAATVVLHDLVAGPAGGRRFRRTVLCGAWAVPLAAVIATAMTATEAGRLLQPLALGIDAAGLVDRLDGFGGAAAGDALAGSLPAGVALAAIAAVAGWTVVARRPLGPRDWVTLAAGLFALSALPGAFGGDPVGLAQAVAVPLAVAAVRLLTVVEAAVPHPRAIRCPAILVGLLVTVVGVAVWPRGGVAIDPETVVRRLRPTVVVDRPQGLLGYAGADAVDPAVFDGWRLLLEGWVAPGGRVLDLSGRPGLFHVLLGYRPTGRFLHAGLAFRAADQAALAAELERARPEAVVLPTARDADGVPATVRLHRLTGAVLNRYVPVEAFPDGVLFVPHGTDLADPSLHARTVTCDWGDAPGRLRLDPPKSGPSDWPSRVLSGPDTVTFSGRLSAAGGVPSADLVVVLLDGRPIADEAPQGGRFRITVQAPRGTGRRLRVAAAMPDGGLRPIGGGAGIEFEGGEAPGDTPDGEPVGMLDGREIVVHDGVRQLAPPPVGPAERAALRLTVVGGEPGRRYRIGDRPPWARGGSDAAIRFGSPDGGRAVVPLGACPQWRGYHEGPLYLWSEDGRPFDGLAVSWSVGRAADPRP
ncbi:hypothetical protein [Thalassobaculum sp.]|uniref:hypothetical protein n=1 Tax=Thalassobaculum sp. TaxID=2022740 RepID=UPI0032EED60E